MRQENEHARTRQAEKRVINALARSSPALLLFVAKQKGKVYVFFRRKAQECRAFIREDHGQASHDQKHMRNVMINPKRKKKKKKKKTKREHIRPMDRSLRGFQTRLQKLCGVSREASSRGMTVQRACIHTGLPTRTI
jgi:hypothetical protein